VAGSQVARQVETSDVEHLRHQGALHVPGDRGVSATIQAKLSRAIYLTSRNP
jgi:hypothetical protein